MTTDRRQRALRLTNQGAEAMASTSVLDSQKVASMLIRLNASDRAAAVQGLALLARAARDVIESKGKRR